MDKRIEEIIRQKANDFTVEPDDSSWQFIEQQLNALNKKRRIKLLSYVAAAAVVVLFVVGTFMLSNQNNELNKGVIATIEQKDSNLQGKDIQNKKEIEEAIQIKDNDNNNIQEEPKKAIDNTTQTKIKPKSEKTHKQVGTNNVQSTNNEGDTTQGENKIEDAGIETPKFANNKPDTIGKTIEYNNTETLLANNNTENNNQQNNSNSEKKEEYHENFASTIELLKKDNIADNTSLGLLFASNGGSFNMTNNSARSDAPQMVNESGGLYKKHVIVSDVSTSDNTVSDADHNLPLSFGLSIKKNINNRFALQTGVVYTYMHSKLSFGQIKKDQTLHYIGIPLSGTMSVANFGDFSLYLSAGGMVQKNIAGNRSLLSSSVSNSSSEKESLTIKQLQWSVNAGAGLSYRFYKNLSLYIEPGWIYYFKNSDSKPSYYTQYPSTFNFQVGFRFSL